MIDIKNFKGVIEKLNFSLISQDSMIYEKEFPEYNCMLKVDFNKQILIYPESTGFKVNDRTTCNFEHPENFVVFECVDRLLTKGYRPEHIELEKRWNLGHDAKGGKADICVYDKNGTDMLCIIECKTDGTEYNKELNNIKIDGGQLFSYWQQERSSKWLVLYASNFNNNEISYKAESINCSDDANILELAKKDVTVKVYTVAHRVDELFKVWSETYEKKLCGDVVFGEDTQAYNIGEKPLRKKDLIDFSIGDKIVNKFEEILRHNNVSDKENAFNRLIALFICKLVDETNKSENDIVEFQYKAGTDTYESLQDRLQRLHQQGMDEFMEEKIFYVSDDYAENIVKTYTGHKRVKMIEELKNTLRILKFYTNNDFAFKEVHNEELFYQNGKVLVEVVQLFEKYRIIQSNSLQLLGDLFEQLLNKGFKQNEGQFFTPVPITRFIWDSLPLDKILKQSGKTEVPKIIDYACGAGHFLTEGVAAINAYLQDREELDNNYSWVSKKLYGIEKDYRLARVSKISLFMHGAGSGNIIFGDGLENYPEKEVQAKSFDILVANPPYSVSAFKPHLKLKNNNFELLDKISNDGSEIETLFVERISQLLKPQGIAAIILPSSILNKESNSFIAARESILKNFNIRAIVQFGSKTFGATGTNTIAVFLEKFNEPPQRTDMILDSIEAIFGGQDLDEWEDKFIFENYLDKINVTQEDYLQLISGKINYTEWETIEYFSRYVETFNDLSEVKAKEKQKLFSKQTQSEKMEWYNQKFYEYVHRIEKEKLYYYALVYTQMTLVVCAPDENKEQEQFLGYKWSNRKGSEGIQILNNGGMLYDQNNRIAEDKIATLVREGFNGNEIDIDSCANYYYYLRLQDMLDFNSINFNKSIKITKIRDKKLIEGSRFYKLSNAIFDISIGDRVVATELIDNGATPVYSANVYEPVGSINKNNLTDFSRDSIVWGIDGDWMVNVIPAGKAFYPTDHCGVLRIASEDIIPRYLAIALEVEGEFEKFSRSNRASIQRIKALEIQVPSKDKQQEIVNKMMGVDAKIEETEKVVNQCNQDLRDKFIDIFGDPITNPKKWNVQKLSNIAEYFIGLTYKPEDISTEGIVVLRSSNIQNGTLSFNDIVRVNKEVKEKLIVKKNDILMCSRNGSARLVGKVALIDDTVNEEMTFGTFMTIIRSEYYSYLKIFFETDAFRNQITDGKTMSINQITTTMLDKIVIPTPNKTVVDEFTTISEQINKIKLEAQEKVMVFTKEREKLIDEYFR